MSNYAGYISDITAAEQSGDRGVELWTIDATGQIWTIYQTTPGGAWSSWEGPRFKGQPVPAWQVTAAGQNTGCLILFILDLEGSVWCIKQLSPGGDWGDWTGPWLAGQPVPFVQFAAAAQGGDRGVSLKAIDQTGEIWVLYQTTPGGAWSNWEGPGFKGQPEPMRLLTQAGQNTGCLELFTTNKDGAVWAIPQTSPGGDWGAWTGPWLHGQPKPFYKISAAEQNGNRGVSLKTIDADGRMWVLYQTTPGGSWSNWEGPGFKNQPTPMRLLTQAGQNTGALEVFTIDTSGNLWTIKQLSPGGDWGPWSTMTMPPAAETTGWSEIGSGYASIVGASGVLYAVDGQGAPWLFSGNAGEWTQVGGAGAQFVGTSNGFYGITPQRDAVNSYDQLTDSWTTIGGAMAELIPAWTKLHGVDVDRYVWMYSGQPNVWNKIGGPFRDVSANDAYCFAVADDGKSVLMTPTGTTAWETIGGPMESLVAAGDNMYGIDAAGTVFLYSGTPMQWTAIGSGFAQVVAWGVDLFGLTADKAAVLQYDADLDAWLAVAGPTGVIAAGAGWIAGFQSGVVSIRLFEDQTWPGETVDEPEDLVAAEAQVAVTATAMPSFAFTKYRWITRMRVTASNQIFNGQIKVRLNEASSRILPVKAFNPGEDYCFSLDYPDDTLSSLSLQVKNHNLRNQLSLDGISAWNIKSGKWYNFKVQQTIPNTNADQDALVLTPDSSVDSPVHTGPSCVYIWRATDSWNGYVGHVSMQLSDGTYISWWPSGDDRKYLPAIKLTYSAPHNNPQTYDDDVDLEERGPDISIPLWDLDETAIKNWWTPYNADSNNYWIAHSANCSTIVYWALLQGGALDVLPEEERQYWRLLAPWTPLFIENLVMRLQEATMSQPTLEAAYAIA